METINKNFENWQEFEKYTENVLRKFRFDIDFRKVFSDEKRKYEIDIVGYGEKYILCLDCKLYKNKDRINSLKEEAKKHYKKVEKFKEIKEDEKDFIPIIVTFLDDSLLIEKGCIFVPYFKLNEFLNNIHFYLEELKYKGSDDDLSRAV